MKFISFTSGALKFLLPLFEGFFLVAFFRVFRLAGIDAQFPALKLAAVESLYYLLGGGFFNVEEGVFAAHIDLADGASGYPALVADQRKETGFAFYVKSTDVDE